MTMPVTIITPKGSKLWNKIKRSRHLGVAEKDCARLDPPLVIHEQHEFFQNPERPGANGLTVQRKNCLKYISKEDQHYRWRYTSLTALEIEAIYYVHLENYVPDYDDKYDDTPRVDITRLTKELRAERWSLVKKGLALDWPEGDRSKYGLTPRGRACLAALREMGAVPQEGE
jgi:hypothetical protein